MSVLLLCFSISNLTAQVQKPDTKPTIVIVHGAWGGAWAWKGIDAMLREKGYNVIGVLDGVTALTVLQERPDISLLITDVTMPGMNGIELADKARLLNPLLAVVYCSGHYADALIRQYASIGEGSVLHKPYEWRDFFTAVQRSMPRKKIADS